MKKTIKKHLLLEQLEERVFLNANPIAAVDHVEPMDSGEAITVVEHVGATTDAAAHVLSVEPAVDVPPVVSEQAATDQTEAGAGGVDHAGVIPAVESSADNATADHVEETGSTDDATGQQAGSATSVEGGSVDSQHDATLTGDVDPGDDASADQADSVAATADSADGQQDLADAAHNQEGQPLDNGLDDAAVDPEATLSTDDADVGEAIDPMVGEDFDFTVGFDNDTGDTVYGPYVDLRLDGGMDGDDTGAASALTDGISFQGATYLGADVDSFVHTVDASDVANGIEHPWATDNNGDPLIVTGVNGQAFQVGDQFVSLRLPFGSFEDTQPQADITVSAHMGANADVDVDLDVDVSTGATLGHDPLDNPTTDNPLRDIQASTLSFKPEVITYDKDIIPLAGVAQDCQPVHDPAHDDVRQWADDPDRIFETNHQDLPTGPNYPARYVATVDIADGQNVSGLQLVEQLEDGVVFTGIHSVEVGGAAVGYSSNWDAATHTLTVTLDNDVTGTAGANDVQIKYDFYVSDQTSGGSSVIDPDTGLDPAAGPNPQNNDLTHIVNDGEVHYSWNSSDNANENITNAVIDAEVNEDGHFSSNPDVDDISHARSLAIQKGHDMETDVSIAGYSPGDRVKYTLEFEVSDYFSFGNITINDMLADGMTLETAGAWTPEIHIQERGADVIAQRDIDAAEMIVGDDGTGNTLMTFDVSQMLQNDGDDGMLEGGHTDGHADGATRGTITYWAVIDNAYDSTNQGEGEGNIDQGDRLSGDVTITGEVYDYSAGTLNGNIVEGNSCDFIDMAEGSLVKDIYAVTHHGTTNYAVGNNPHLSAGDTVTYHLSYDMPMSSTENFKITDYLPLPVFDAHDPDLDPVTPNDWVFDGTDYDGTGGTGTPEAGHWGYTIHDTYHTLGDSTVNVAAGTGNTLVFDYGEYHDAEDDHSVIDLVFTVTISSEPFADGMLLTNQARASEEGTPLSPNPSDDIIQIVLDEPDLHLTKGVVETDNNVADADTPVFTDNGAVDSYFSEPGSAGFRSDAGTISSTWLAGHDINTAINNVDQADQVTMAIVVENTGQSGAFDITIKDDLPTGYGQADVANIHVSDGAGNLLAYSGNLFDGTGITLTDDADGALNAYDATNGANVLVITYDLTLNSSVTPDQALTNTATLTNYAGAEDGTDFSTTDITDTAVTETANIHVDKDLVTTEIVNGTNANDEAVIGEQVTYQVTVTLPEGHADNVQVVDTLDSGLTFVELTGISSSSGDIISTNGSFDLAHFSGSQSGQEVTFDLGTLTNSNTDNTTPETITLVYTAFVNNTSGNQSTTQLDNSATVSFYDDGGGLHGTNTDHADPVTVIEPDLQVTKTVDVDGTGTSNGDAGDPVTYTITISHSGSSETDAYDVDFSDTVPSAISGVTVNSVTDSAGVLGAGDFTVAGNTVTLNGTVDIPEARTITIELTGTLVGTITPGTTIDNTAQVTWQSLDAGHAQDGTANERTDPVDGAPNDYADTGSATIHVNNVSIDKTLVGTELDSGDHEAVIGELVTYQVVIHVPEGQMNSAALVDHLDAGLTFQQVTSVSTTGDLSSDGAPIAAANITTTTSGSGHDGDAQSVTFDFGNLLVNGDNNNGTETITIQYTALVENFNVNERTDHLNNSAQFTFEDSSHNPVTSNTDSATDITVVEPTIETVKTINGEADGVTSTVEVGDIVSYTVVLTNSGDATAYEVTAQDTLAQGTTYVDDGGVHTPSASTGGVTITDNGDGTISITSATDGWDIAEGASVTITYYAQVGAAYFDNTYGNNAANPVNTVDADWSSNDNSGSITTSGRDRIYDDGASTGGHTYSVDGTQDDDDARFDLNYNGAIGDTVFFDADNSGSENAGDVGISGVDVTLTADLDNDGNADFTTTVRTDADGEYHFTNLAAFDDYTITVDTATSGGVNPLSLSGEGYTQTYDLDEGTVALDNTATSINLDAGQVRDDVDFGYAGQNTVGDVVWWDADADGIQDANEGGLNGLTVTLHADIDGDGDYEYTTTTTTASHTVGGVTTDGWYSFGDYLPGGDYQVVVTPPAGSSQTYDIDGSTAGASADTGNFSLTADQDRDDIDFGYRGTGALGDFVWFDADHDGNQDDGANSGLAGVTMNLSADFDGDGTADYTTSTTTANDGSYSFGNLLGGEYTVSVDTTSLPSGAANWDQTYDNDGTGTADTSTVILAAGTTDNTVDFGYTGTGSLGDRVWLDLDADGVQDVDELGLANVTVNITADVDGDGINEWTGTATTDDNGIYTFDHLPAASYTTTIDTSSLPDGFGQTFDKNDGLTPFTSPHSDTTALGIGEDIDDVDFGYRGTGSIGDFVWYDADGDGIQDEGAASGLGGIDVTLTGDFDQDGVDETRTTTTAADGSYHFDHLFAGNYTVTVDHTDLPGGMVATHDLDGIGTPDVAAVALAAGQTRADVDFGYRGTGSIGDTVFFDADNSGDETAGDVGISGVDVTLTADIDGDGTSEYTQTVRTDADGNYLFENLAAFNNYVISVDTATSGGTDPLNLNTEGYSQTYDLDGTGDNTASGVTLTAGQNRDDVDFGYAGQNTVGDIVWWDADADGIQDANEGGLNGLTVTLHADIDGDGDYEYTTTTTTASHTVGGVTTDGWYSFGDYLPGGDYQVVVTPPAASSQTYDIDGSTAGASADTGNFSLTADQDREDIDFGYRGTGSLGDFVWFDANNDSNQNDGVNSGLAGVTMNLSADFDGDGRADYTATTITANDGSYSFGNLLGGTYTVAVDDSTLPSGTANWRTTHDLDGNMAGSEHIVRNIALADGQDLDTVDFGYTGIGSLGDRVWLDLDDDGVQDPGELGLANVEVQIHADVDGDGIDEYSTTTTTDANGNYSFDHLPAADYTVTVNTATFVGGSAAAEQTYDLDDGTGAFATADSTGVILGIAEDRVDVDFGYIGTGSIGDFVWYDANNNGLQDDGPLSGLSGVTVTLTGDFNNDGDATDTYTTVTDGNGGYLFENLFGGSYTVTINQDDLPGGTNNWNQSYDLDDGHGAFATADSSGAMDLGINGQGMDRNDADFGYVGNSSIGDLVFFDADHSGDLSAGDTGITNLGVTLTADVDGDGVADYTWTTVTDGNGNYLFEDLPDFTTIYPGFTGFEVTIDPTNLPPHSEQSYDLDGVSPEHVTSNITLGVNEDRTDVDFGYITRGTGSIGDTVWYDADADGVQAAGEQGLAGVELQLEGDITGDGVTDVTYTTTTDANGQYIFDELLLGSYTVSVIGRPDGMEETFDLDGLGSPDAASLELADGEHNNNVDFGYTGSASIGDTIFFDAAGDGGPYNPAEDGTLAGVTVTLTGDVNNDGIEDTLTTTTDANGHYIFENLRDGDYEITVNPADLPAGMDQTSDPDAALDNTSSVTLAGGIDNLDQDFGYTGTGIIGDRIWDDTDGDGVQDAGESGLNGVDVTVSVDFDGDGVVDYTETVTTAGDGDYSFDHLPAGSYTITVDTDTVPADAVITGDPDANPDSTSTVNLPAGGINEDQDFGYHATGAATGSIGDTIYFDSNGDGSQAGVNEPGLAGVTVTLTGDIDGDGVMDTITTTTDANGGYLFDNLAAGDYTVIVDPTTLPDGMTQTADPQGPLDNTATVTLAAGADVDTMDFGYDGTGSIGDTVYFDGNNDGDQDTNEGGIAGVDVYLELDLDGDGVTDYVDHQITDADGNYRFNNLPAGDYVIRVDSASLPDGMQQTDDPDSSLDNQSTLALAGGEHNDDQDFGYTGAGSIGDTIWNDTDGDGTQSGTETGIAGVDVLLEADIDGDGITDYTTTVTTDGNGNYHFENLPEGTYTITVDPATVPTGMTPSGDPDGTTDNTTTVNLVADENNEDIDFGYNSGTASVGDTIFFDENGDGTQNGTEGGLAGVTVTLTGDIDGDGTVDTLTTTTDSNGHYVFENLAAGDYTVTVDQTTVPAGMNPTSDLDGDGTVDTASAVTLAANEHNVDQDFGFQGTGSIGDSIWDDANGDGIQDPTETGLGGVDVTLEVDFDGDGIVDYTMTDTTDPNGGYSFDNLPAGSYTIKVDTDDVPATYVPSGDPDGNLDSETTVDLAAGESNNDQDFGYSDSGAATGSIGDTIWFDADGDGVNNDGATSGLGGVTVTLTGDIDGDGTPETISTTTDANGSYLFDNLPAGDYSISVDTSTLPGGMNPTADLDGDGTPDSGSTVTLASGENNTNQDFGYTGTGEIGDTLYVDTDGDGVEDPGEGGLAGATVTISVDLDGDGIAEYTDTAVTDADGHYSFTNLPEGEYTVSVNPASLPADVTGSGDPDGTPDNVTVVNLGPGETNEDIDFGYTGSGSIGDTIFYDADGNGFQSPGERGLSGVTVTLQGDFDGDGTVDSVTTTTDSSGHYQFEHLRAGNYTVYVDSTGLPAGMTQTGDPDGTLDDQATLTLGAGEHNTAQDFGYTGPNPFHVSTPSVPVEPTPPEPLPVPPTPEPAPVATPVVAASEPAPVLPGAVPVAAEQVEEGFIPDSLFMRRYFGDEDQVDLFGTPFAEIPWQPVMVPVSPIYSGHAEPGTTLEFVLYDALGNQVAEQSVMADTAGNWLASFPGAVMYDLPHHMSIEQTMSSYNASTPGFFNMRTYYSPNFSSMVFSSTHLDVNTIFAYLPSTVMESMHAGNLEMISVSWDGFDAYEFSAPSIHPASNSH